MRIGIDASRAFVSEPTGTERYSFEVITRMLALPEAAKHEWVLYVRKDAKFESNRVTKLMNSCNHVTFVTLSLPLLWTQVGLAYSTWIDGLDRLWIPAHTLPVLRKPNIDTIVTIHGIEYEWLPAYENKLQRWYLPLSTKYAVLSAKKIIAVSEFTKKQLIERLGAEENKINVIHEGYIRQVSNNQEPNKIQILNNYNLKTKNYLLFVGTVQPRKNLVRLIEAFLVLSAKYSGLRLVIAGKLGWMYEDVLESIKKFGLEDRVIITGYVNDEDRQVLLKNALAYVQPSITEGFGLPVLEAMAAGVPVASSKGGALEEVVGKAGMLFDPFDVHQIVSSLEFIVRSQRQRHIYIKKGLDRVKKFSWEKAAKETLNLIVGNI